MANDASTARLSLLLRSNDHPRSPQISYGELFKQFKADVYGKEVQSAATYSYMWMADQMGHVYVGILVNRITTFGARHLWQFFGWHSFAEIAGLIAAIAIVAVWEASTFFSSEQSAKGLFPLGRELLRDNAIIATLYMALGGVVGFGFHIGLPWSDVVVIIACTIIAIWLDPRWLRQKIIWQKAALPYLSRLADVEPTMGQEAAKMLQELLDNGAPPKVKPAQVIIGGTVNVNYWPWSESQVIIIDDVGPLIAPQRDQHEDVLDHFRGILNDELKSVAPVLANCHTVWVIGDLCPPGKTQLAGEVLNKFAAAVSDYVEGKEKPLVIELRAKSAAKTAAGDSERLGPEAAARYVPTSRSNGDDAMAQISKAL